MSTPTEDRRTKKVVRQHLEAVDRLLQAADQLRRAQDALAREARRPELKIALSCEEGNRDAT
jgi:hypothetical protein